MPASGTDRSLAETRSQSIPDCLVGIDLNNFDFDYIVLVNLDADYRLGGVWRLTVDQVRAFCAHRPKFRKHQVTQAQFKREASRHLGETL